MVSPCLNVKVQTTVQSAFFQVPEDLKSTLLIWSLKEFGQSVHSRAGKALGDWIALAGLDDTSGDFKKKLLRCLLLCNVH